MSPSGCRPSNDTPYSLVSSEDLKSTYIYISIFFFLMRVVWALKNCKAPRSCVSTIAEKQSPLEPRNPGNPPGSLSWKAIWPSRENQSLLLIHHGYRLAMVGGGSLPLNLAPDFLTTLPPKQMKQCAESFRKRKSKFENNPESLIETVSLLSCFSFQLIFMCTRSRGIAVCLRMHCHDIVSYNWFCNKNSLSNLKLTD